MKIFVAGHNGMVGSAVVREIIKNYDAEIILADRSQVNLERQKEVEDFFEKTRPDIVIMCAARVGGIKANDTFRAEFIYENLQIQNNIIHSAYRFGVTKLIFLGSSCIYPKICIQPMKEEHLLTGALEYTNEPYAIAKIAGIKMCENYYKQYGCEFISLMPTNLYGINDDFDLENSHVIPALISKFHTAKKENHQSVNVWGSGKALREFMFVEDLASAVLHVMKNVTAYDIYSKGISHLNIGTGEEMSIAQLAENIAKVVGYEGEIQYDSTKPDGHPRKLLDIKRLKNTGFTHKYSFREAIALTYDWYKITLL